MRLLAALVFAALATACETTPRSVDLAQQLQPRSVSIVDRDGRTVGQAVFREAPAGVLIRLEFSGGRFAPGWHGLHLHARGDCSDFAAGFQTSGGHISLNHDARHGLLNPLGPEAGDLPNLFVSPNGVFGAEVLSPYVTMHSVRVGDRAPLLDADGAALLIHEATDNHRDQPIGGAGARVACAALTPLP